MPDPDVANFVPVMTSEGFLTSLMSELRKLEGLLKNLSTRISYSYCKLRFFSGRSPTPSGEDDFNPWINEEIQAIEE